MEPTTELTAMSEQEKRPLLPTERADHPPSSDFPSRRVGKAGADGPAARVPPREGALPLAPEMWGLNRDAQQLCARDLPAAC